MALLQHLQRKDDLLDPKGSLSSAIPAQAIAQADQEAQAAAEKINFRVDIFSWLSRAPKYFNTKISEHENFPNYSIVWWAFLHICRSTITVFPEAVDEDHEYRVWNAQFIRYAGYKMPDGSILGDPANVDFTEVCIDLGWKPPKEKSQCDVLPLVLQANGGDPQFFELEKEDVLQVPLTHPQ